VRQYRLLLDRISLEIPGGRVNEDETPADAAVRECLEETGVRCHELKPLLVFQPGLDTLHNPTHLFFSEECEEVGERFIHREEVTDTSWIPLSECKAMIFSGQIVDSLSIISLLAYLAKAGP
jgi:8-oxo-dGTP pyrophosphatase MutT (NUDIX family)